jgi:flagellar FliL protein
MAKKPTEPKEIKASGGKRKLILLILIILLILAAAGGGAAYYFLFRQPAEQAGESADTHDPASEPPASEHPAPEHSAEKQSEPVVEQAPLIYHALAPVTVNITPPSPVRFLRINITIVTRVPNVVIAVDKHLPMIRNDLLTRLSGQSYAVINTPEGKNALREELKKMFSDILMKAREPADIQDVLFTDLVMQ